MSDGYLYDKLVILNNVYHNSLVENNTFVTPTTIKVPLYTHQQTLVQNMHQFRERMIRGFLLGDHAINGKMGIIGDPAGSGKTLSTLAYLASQSLTYPRITSELAQHSTKYFFSHELNRLPETNWAHLIIVPHSIFGQWKQEFDQNTSLSYVPIETKRIMKGDAIAKSIIQHRIVLTTSTCYKHVQEYADQHQIQWDNIMIDEASSIYFHSTDPPLRFQFLWLITNQWIPLIMKSPNVIKPSLYHLRDRVDLHPDLGKWLLEDNPVQYEGQLASSSFFKDYINLYHLHRSLLVLRNSDSQIQSSMKLPQLAHEILHCRPNMTLNSLTSLYLARQREPNVRSKHVPYLFQALGIEFHSVDEYLELQPSTKHALIKRMINDNECVICLESCKYPTMVQCCYHIFCGKCLLKTALISMKCPTCREGLTTKQMCCLRVLSPEERMISKNKMEACLEQIQQNKNGKIIIYSPFINIYYELFDMVDKLNMKAERIETNLFSLIKTIRNFQQGKTNVLFISNIDAIRGMNLTSATHLIFYHELPSYESKQLLIHSCQRLGRTSPLQIVHLYSEIQV